MKTLNWPALWRKSKLGRFEIITCFGLALIAAGLILLTAYATADTEAAKQTLMSMLNTKVTRVLYWLDSFEFANSAGTFLFWSMVGVLVYAGIASFFRMSEEVEYEHKLGSPEYVRPKSRTKDDILLAELTNAVVLATGVIVLFLGVLGLLHVILPAFILNVRAVTLQASLANIFELCSSVLILTVALCLVWLTCKLIRHHQSILDT